MDESIKSHFLLLYCMVLADGIIDTRELEVLYRIGTENYGLSPEEIGQAVREAGTSYLLPKKISDKIALLYELALIAWADGVIEESEKEIMRKYALKMGFMEENIEKIVSFLLEEAKENKPLQQVIEKILNS
ncbi:MAG: TerB family tellurite resistance protein [Muribaculaceae bacterium]|nr:TerB family tellurite resistance protein [Muribaculaceae bacterium]